MQGSDDPRRNPRRPQPPGVPRRRGPPEALSELLPKLLGEVGLGATAQAVSVIRAWDEALGPDFQSHCRPDGVRNGVIHARVRDSSWAQRLQLEKPRILRRLRDLLGDDAPADLRVRIGSLD